MATIPHFVFNSILNIPDSVLTQPGLQTGEKVHKPHCLLFILGILSKEHIRFVSTVFYLNTRDLS